MDSEVRKLCLRIRPDWAWLLPLPQPFQIDDKRAVRTTRALNSKKSVVYYFAGASTSRSRR